MINLAYICNIYAAVWFLMYFFFPNSQIPQTLLQSVWPVSKLLTREQLGPIKKSKSRMNHSYRFKWFTKKIQKNDSFMNRTMLLCGTPPIHTNCARSGSPSLIISKVWGRISCKQTKHVYFQCQYLKGDGVNVRAISCDVINRMWGDRTIIRYRIPGNLHLKRPTSTQHTC